MKWLASLIILLSLVLGVIAASTAYLPRVDAIDPADQLTLAAPAGQQPDDPHTPLLAPPPDEPLMLTAQHLEQLREAGVTRVRVQEFAWQRWTHRWWFVLATAGLIAGAGVIRLAQRRQVAAKIEQQEQTGESPENLLQSAHDAVQQLRHELTHEADRTQQLHLIIQQLDTLQADQLDPFVATRPTLTERLGVAGYAQLMDRFAAAERQVHRAWSAAADEVLDEALLSLDQAAPHLQAALDHLHQIDTNPPKPQTVRN